MYDLASMTCVYELLGHTDIVLCLDTVVFSGHILLASGSKDHTVSISQLEHIFFNCVCLNIFISRLLIINLFKITDQLNIADL